MIPRRPLGSQQSPKSQFYPRRFFEQGAGRPWLEHLQATQDDLNLQSRFLWYRPIAAHQDQIVESSILVGDSNSARNTTTAPVCCPALVYYHIHKNGGGSMARHVPLDMDAYNSDRERVMGHDEYAKTCQQRMQQVYDNQQLSMGGIYHYNSTGETKHATLQPQQQTVDSIFTFLRDPIERFLSSLGQVLQGPIGRMRKSISPCYHSMTTAALIECVLDKMEGHPEQEQTSEHSTSIATTVSTLTSSSSFSSKRTLFLDQHFAPQSYELYSGILGYDIGIVVLDLRDSLSWIVEELGGSANHKPINSAVGSAVWRFPQFQLSTSALTSAMKRRICTLYQPDVLLLRETGVTSTSCEERNNKILSQQPARKYRAV
jgi:Sulfotransferase family